MKKNNPPWGSPERSGKLHRLGGSKTRPADYRLPMAGALILLLSLAAMLAIWRNLQEMETKRSQEHEALARSIGETAKNFLVNRQYDYFLDVLKLIQKTPFIEHIAVMIEGRVAFQAGSPSVRESGGGPRRLDAALFPSVHRVRKLLDYQNGKQAEMIVAFSLEEFRRPRMYILIAFVVILALLACLGWVGFRLYHTHRRLVLAEETKEHMIHSITHDARQDLFVIQGKLSSLLPKIKNGSKPANLERDLKLTMESADSIERYLNNLKDQQGLAKGRVEMLCEPVSMREVIVAVTDAFAEKMHMRHMSVRLGRLEPDLKVSVDPQMLKRIFMNLMHNAMKYSPAGGTVTVWQEVRPDGIYTFVRDEGQGIPRENWQLIFEPYVQLNPKKEGMGLGLATARRLVALLRGRLEVAESVVGRGTTMCLMLPAVEKTNAASAPAGGNNGAGRNNG